MSILSVTLLSIGCFVAGAIWAKSKATTIDPDIELSLSNLAEEDAKAAAGYLKEKVNELREQRESR